MHRRSGSSSHKEVFCLGVSIQHTSLPFAKPPHPPLPFSVEMPRPSTLLLVNTPPLHIAHVWWWEKGLTLILRCPPPPRRLHPHSSHPVSSSTNHNSTVCLSV
jgi:hypothetical protein